ELPTAVNAVRTLAALGTISFTLPTPTTSVTIRRQHLLDLRTALDGARALLGLTALTYTDPTITAGTTTIKAAPITEMGDGVKGGAALALNLPYHRSFRMIDIGTRLGPYEIVSFIGAGGMGHVFQARDSRLDRDVAIKGLPDSFAGDRVPLSRFEREAKAIAALSHPNIVAIFDFGTSDGVTYAVTELLEGETLRAHLDRGRIAWRRACEVGASIADGLGAAHARGIVHRDLKPENLFLGRDGRVKILDFGLARSFAPLHFHEDQTETAHQETARGAIIGTIGYMSPEQGRGGAIQPATHIFLLACVLYEMLAGGRAFARGTQI